MAEIMCMRVRLLDAQVVSQMLSGEQEADVFPKQRYDSNEHQHTQSLPCLRPTVHVFMTLQMH